MEREGHIMPEGTTGPETGAENEPTRGTLFTPEGEAEFDGKFGLGAAAKLAAQLLAGSGRSDRESAGEQNREDPIERDLPAYRRYDERQIFDNEALKTEAQIRWLEGLMTKFETGSAMDLNSYLSTQAQRGERGLIDKITHLNKGAYYYFQTRMAANKALNLPPEIGGSVEGFLQYGQLLGDTEVQDTLTQRPEVARAYAKLEARANVHAYDASGKFIKSDNPAFADVDRLDKIEANIGNELAEEFVDTQIRNRAISTEDREKCLTQEKEIQLRNVKQAEVLWRVWKRSARQNGLVFKPLAEANVALRRDGQKALAGNMTEEQYERLQKYLLYLPYLERIEHWETIVALADWKTSLSGPVNEDAIQRLTWGGIYHQKNAQGIEAIRPGIDYDSKDFFSYLVTTDGFLTDPNNLRPEPWQEEENKKKKGEFEERIKAIKKLENLSEKEKQIKIEEEDEKLDGSLEKAVYFTKYSGPKIKDGVVNRTPAEHITLIDENGVLRDVEVTVYKREIKSHTDSHGNIIPGRTEKLIVHPNGVVEIDPNNPFDLSKIKLFMAGGKDHYTGKFTAYYLRYADEMRKNVMNPEKIGRDPFAKPLESLIGLSEHLDSIDKETEKFLLGERNAGRTYTPGSKEEKDKVAEHLDKKRGEGKVFKEDGFYSLMMGMMEFQSKGLKANFLGENINLEEADRTINFFRSKHMLTDDQAEKAKKAISVLMGCPSNEFLNKLTYSIMMIHYREKPHEAFLALLFEILKQGFSEIK